MSSSAQHGDEHLRPSDLAAGAVDHLDRLPGVIDEHPLTRRVGLSHGGGQSATPGGMQVTEPAVAIALRLPVAVFLPEQHQRDVRLAQFGVDARPVRLRPRRLGGEWRGEQLVLECHVVERRRYRPGNADHGGAAEILGHGVAADADHDGDLVAAMAADVFEAKDFSNLTHWQSRAWHGAPRIIGDHRAVG